MNKNLLKLTREDIYTIYIPLHAKHIALLTLLGLGGATLIQLYRSSFEIKFLGKVIHCYHGNQLIGGVLR